MSKSSFRKPRKAPIKKALQKVPHPHRKRLTLAQAKELTERQPQQSSGWKALSAHLIEAGECEEALEASNRALALAPHDHEVYELLAKAEDKLGNTSNAMERLEQALDIQPESVQARFHLSRILFYRAQNIEALEHIEQANRLAPNNNDILSHKGNVLIRLYHFDAAIAVFDKLTKRKADNYVYWNNAGNLRKDIGLLDDADDYYKKSIKLAGVSSALPFSNRLALLHYRPDYSREAIFEVCKEWDARFAPASVIPRPQPDKKALPRCIRVGLLSDGFRSHPVGMMIVTALENLNKHEVEIYAYSTNNAVDHLTVRIRSATSQWLPIQHLSDEELTQRIRDDEIDILIDLCGHNTGSRMQVMAQEPAPILAKWVGGLINTTGLKAIDYLISDNIESPQGDDAFYTEKLIRMPDDYICYAIPDKTSEVQPLPALNNGYITLGCFNNPTKINSVVLAEWAKLMHDMPSARLYLKGHQYNSIEFCQRIRDIMSGHGIDDERLIIEGPSKHLELLEAYSRVDIALDPWPYSGGLTTCEAMLMGVPVVTLPGPTFAGRHSATHLTNAGMPELVTNNWDEYRQRVIGLASDLQSLSTIRTHLRDILLQSPVCNGPRFAKHFTTAMRAIWQRYCEDKVPAALSLNQQGEARFEDEEHPVEILHPEPIEDEQSEFSWQFQGKITTIDNGAELTSSPEATKLLKLGAFSMISFDPASKIADTKQLQATGELHHYPHTVLGDGKPATLHACLDPAMSATLRPLSSIKTLTGEKEGPKVLAKLPVNTIQLDKIKGLESIDWLILDNMNDNLAVLENGKKALADTLLIQARVNFQPTHENQPELTLISNWAARHGFNFYRLNDPMHLSHLPQRDDLVKQQATQLVSADAIYVPNAERMAALTDNQRMKLAFMLHTVYGIQDVAFDLIATVSQKQAIELLEVQGFLPKQPQQAENTSIPLPAGPPIPQSEHIMGAPLVSVVCATYNHVDFIEDAIKGFIAQKTDFPFEVIIHDDASTDGTQEIVRRYAEQYPDLIRPIYQEVNQYKNKRPLDICLPLTKGKYIALCEGDDYWADINKIQIQFDFMEKNPEIVVSHHNAFVLGETGLISDSKLPPHCIKSYSKDELLKNNCFVLTMSMMFKKVFDKLPKEKGNVGNGDNFLISMLGLYGDSKYLPDIKPAVYRLHGNSTWSSKNETEKSKMLSNSFHWIGKYHERKGRLELSKFYYKKSSMLLINE